MPSPVGSDIERLLPAQPPTGPLSPEQLIEQGQAHERAGRPAEARAQYEQAMRLLPAPDPVKASMLLRWIANCFERESLYSAAQESAAAAVAAAESSGDETTMAYALNVMGIVRWRQGELNAAEDHLHKALVHGAEGSDPRVLSHINTNLGSIASIQGDFREAVRYFEEALAIGRLHALPENILPTLINIGVTNLALARHDAAHEAFIEASGIADALGMLQSRVLIDINRAALEVARQQYVEATRLCDEGVRLAEHLADPLSRGEAEKVYGVIARETLEFPAAERHLLDACRIAEQLDNLTLLGEASRELAELYARTSRNREMLQMLNRARRCFDQLRSRHEMADVARRMARLEGDFQDVAQEWGESIESKDLHTQGHCERVAELSTALAARVGFDEGTLVWFRIGALLHDVGKLIIPADVLNKPGKLSDEEWELMRRHPGAGVDMLSDVEFPWDILPLVRSHHERWDGRGYPDGLRDEQIPMAARILCIADVYDALTSARSYKRPFSHLEAMEIMRRDVGTQFDPQLFPHFEELMRKVAEGSDVSPPPARSSTAPKKGGAEEDDLTHALMRRAFIDVATAVLAERRRTDGVTSLLVIDVDEFKKVNDTFGHLAGDDALRAVVEVARRYLRPGQYVGRYAGDEFVVLLTGVDAEGAVRVAEQMRSGVAGTMIPLRDSAETFSVSLSIGAATAPVHGTTFEALFDAADRTLFKAKRDGRNRVALAGDADSPTRRLTFSRFVGRRNETRLLVQALDAAVNGSPQLRLLVGEAGVGKSTLVRQLAPELRLRSVASVEARSLETASPTLLAPWADLIAGIDSQGMTPRGEWPMLSRLVPALNASPIAEPAFDSVQSHQFTRELVLFLQEVASIRPLVLVLEDVQWMDAASWDALEAVLTQLGTERICLFLTLRSEEAASEQVRLRRQRLSRDVRTSELTVARLSRAEVMEILQQGLKKSVDERLYDFVAERTEGNPFLLLQLLGTMIEEDVFTRGEKGWSWTKPAIFRLPRSMTDLVGRRLNNLKPETLRILAFAAAIGRRFSLRFVAEVAEVPYERVLDAVDDALLPAVLEPPEDDRDDSYSFAHSLLVESVLRTMNPPRRRAAHERIGDMLSERTPGALTCIASQYSKSANRAKAYTACRSAATEALSNYALDETQQFLELALEASTTEPEEIEIYESLARVAELSGRWADVEHACDHLMGSQVVTAVPIKAVATQLRRLVARFRLGVSVREAEVECRELLVRAVHTQSMHEIVQTRGLLVQLLARKGEINEAIALAAETQLLAEGAEDRGVVADAMYRRAITLNAVRPADAAEVLEALIVLAGESGDRVMEARAYLALGVARSRTENDAAGALAFRESLSLAREAQALDVAAAASMNLGVIELRSGALMASRASLVEARRLYTTLQNVGSRLVAIYNLANVEREAGSMEEASTLYTDAIALATGLGADDILIGAHAGLGLTALRLDQQEAAAEALENALDALGDRADWWFQGRELLESLAVRLTASRGEPQAAHVRFSVAVERLLALEDYAVAWFVADCAGALVEQFPSIRAEIDQHSETAVCRGFKVISARFTALRDLMDRAPSVMRAASA